jgi:uncharacterized membrane protein SpoIIM required for sporulation
MKETRFISQNKEKWLESETLLNAERKDPGKLSDLFVQVVDDLSYSRTFYPNRSVRVYINKIAREYFSIIYNHQRERKGRFRLFWLDELPQVIIHCRTPLLISLATFLLAIAIGVFSSVKEPQFASSILGPSYVAMTKENIEKGDPMAVYKEGHQVDMFLGITFNNLMVAFRAYVFGIFFSIGTLGILISNGIMVGCFQFFFIERGLFAESALTIWLHGTLEISSIILAGGAGLTLGSGLIFPGTYSRLQAFQISAMRSLKLMLGVAPVLVVAGIIESFLTRYTDTPNFIRLLLIILSALFIVGYFVVYPWLKSRSGFEEPLEEVRLAPSADSPIDVSVVKNNADILKDSFLSYKKNFNKIIPWVVAVASTIAMIDVLTHDPFFDPRIQSNLWVKFLNGLLYALKTPNAYFVVANAIGSSLVLYRTFLLVDQDAAKEKRLFHWPGLIQTMAAVAVVYLGLWSLAGWGTFLFLLLFAFILLFIFVQLSERITLFRAIPRTWDLLEANFGQALGLQFTLALMCFSFLLVLSAPLIYVYTTIFEWNFARTDTWSSYVVNYIELFIKASAFYLIVPLVAICLAYLYYSLKEGLSAHHLKHSISKIGSKYIKRPDQ